jgi:hypothetical protein
MEIVEACAELIDRHAKRIENAIGDPPEPAACHTGDAVPN